jgi:hypothetical protein
MPILGRLRHAWNAFRDEDEEFRIHSFGSEVGGSYGSRPPDRVRFNVTNERSIISSIYTRLSIDVARVDLRHVRVDDDNRYLSDVDSGLNYCLQVEANLDQAARAFRQDIAMTLFDKGVAALVPVDTTVNPSFTNSFDIKTLRVGEVVQWYPQHVKVSVYNEAIARRQELILPKSLVAIVENPFYSVMNEPNSTLQRLVRKLNLLDFVDEQSGSGKLDLIIQLPYVIKSDARKAQAEQRRQDIEFQLKGSKYGIAYTDGTEKITQLNRPAENNLLKQVEALVSMLYSQLGITEEIMNLTADEKVTLNYYDRTIEPIVTAIAEAMNRTFLTKTARSQNQAVRFFWDRFRLVPLSEIAEIGDKLTRNEIASSNEIRGVIGWKPSKDPKADELRNSNMPEQTTAPDSTNKDSATNTGLAPSGFGQKTNE